MTWIILLAGVVAGGIWGWILWDERQGEKAWEAYRAEAVKRGVKFDIGEFLQAPIKGAENFAESPLFRRSYGTAGLKFPYFSLPARDWQGKDNGETLAEKLEAWRQGFIRAKWLARNDRTPAPEALWRALQRFEAPWERLVEAAAKPGSRFAVAWERGSTYALGDQDYLYVLHSAAGLGELRAQIRLAEGKGAEALGEWQLLWRLAEALKREPGLACWMEKWGIQARAIELLAVGMDERKWSGEELTTIEAALGREEVLADFARAYASDRALIADEYLHFRERWLLKTNEAGVEPEFTDRFLGIYHGLVLFNRDVDFALGNINVAGKRRVKNGERMVPAPAYFEMVERRRYRIYEFLSLNPDTVNRGFWAATRFDLARVACALERFRLAKSAYPEGLAVLVPEFIEAIPHDIFDGQPLRYRREGEAFVLYSVGPDERDDRGRTNSRVALTTDWGWKEWVGKPRAK